MYTVIKQPFTCKNLSDSILKIPEFWFLYFQNLVAFAAVLDKKTESSSFALEYTTPSNPDTPKFLEPNETNDEVNHLKNLCFKHSTSPKKYSHWYLVRRWSGSTDWNLSTLTLCKGLGNDDPSVLAQPFSSGTRGLGLTHIKKRL